MKLLKNKEALLTGSITLICLVYLYNVLKLPFGSPTKPNTGFLPLILGILGFCLSGFLTVKSLMQQKSEEKESWLPKEGVYRLIGYACTVLIFIITFKLLGAIIGIFLLVLALVKISGVKGWKFPVLLGLICSICTFLIFNKTLGVPLPNGLLELFF